jgi:O-succinylbenzoate synthase
LSISQQIIQEATQQGVQCVVTSAIETGIGIAGVLHLVTASPEVTLECGMEDDLLTENLSIQDGTLTIWV